MEQRRLKIQKSLQTIKETYIFNSEVIEVKEFKDLGTWKEIGKVLSNQGSNF